MATIDLIFGPGANPPGSPVDIVFGDDDGAAGGSVTLLASGAITGLRGSIVARSAVVATASGSITGLRGSIGGQYNVNVERPVVRTTAGKFQPAQPAAGATLARYQQALALQATTAARWQDAATLGAASVGHWQNTLRLSRAIATAWQQGQRLGAVPSVGYYQQALPASASTATRMQQAQRLPAAAVLQRMQEGFRTRAYSAQRMQQAQHLAASVHRTIGTATPLHKALGGRYQEAWPPRPGIHSPTLPPQPPPCYDPSLPAHLVFAELQDAGLPAHLVFACEREGGEPVEPGETIVVPARRFCIVLNTITLHRVDTGAQLRAHAFSASLDFASWTWSWSASLHHDAEGLLGRDSAGDPAELQALVNGVQLRLRLENLELDERFLPQKRWAVSGRGKASILAAPHAPIMSFGSTADRTAQQLAADVLTINGVGIGWSLDWGIADWLVPAGAWALQGSYIDAVNDIAAAAGGYVQAHPTDAVLRVLPRYPLPPWEWGSVTPDFEIPRGAAEVVGTKFVDKPAYNGVYVGGESVGVFGPFKRTGTDGATLAPQVTHPLITHSDAHRARAIAEISDTGSQEHVTLSMQVLAETGLIVPGQFVRYVGDRTVMGIVRRTSIDLNRPKLRQTIALETHVAD